MDEVVSTGQGLIADRGSRIHWKEENHLGITLNFTGSISTHNFFLNTLQSYVLYVQGLLSFFLYSYKKFCSFSFVRIGLYSLIISFWFEEPLIYEPNYYWNMEYLLKHESKIEI